MDISTLNRFFSETLILNPTENIYPLISCTHFTKGLYIPQFKRDLNSNIIFGGRNIYQELIEQISKLWKTKLNADKISLALLSGMHACIILFMSIGNPKDKVVIIPTEAGGHFATRPILKRLGYEVYEMKYVNTVEHMGIDVPASIELIENINPKFIFIERSDGLIYEDFSWLKDIALNSYKIFDASQYITSILLHKYKSPFEMGFNMILSTLHKDFPGVQQAMVAADSNAISNDIWGKLVVGMKSYMSSIHPQEIINSCYFLKHIDVLKKYSDLKEENSNHLYNRLIDNGVDVIKKSGTTNNYTQQIWIKAQNQNHAFRMFTKLESLGILVNYFKIPYDIGQGLRLGTGAATIQGLRPQHIGVLADIIAKAIDTDSEMYELKHRAKSLILDIKLQQDDIIIPNNVSDFI